MMQSNVINMILQFAINTPERVAVLEGERAYTYGELSSSVNDVARLVYQQGQGEESVVGIRMNRSYHSICATLGVMKAGAAFLPIDKDIPQERMSQMCDIANVSLILTDSADEVLDDRFINITNHIATHTEPPDSFFSYKENQLSYVIFTSGSTGTPKGVMIEFAGMQNHICEKIRILEMDEHSCVAFNASISFDISVWQMFAPLSVGGKIVLFCKDDILYVSSFCRRLIQTHVTLLEVVPTYLALIIGESRRSGLRFPDLKALISTGEQLTMTIVKHWFALMGSVPIINAYGPTEASDDITHCVISYANQFETIPIGKAIRNVSLVIENSKGDICANGEKGELLVRGVCVGRGYIKNSEETQRFFRFDQQLNSRVYRTGDLVSRDSDGNYLFWGRIDTQVKLRGYRVELTEIEHAIERYDDTILQAVALVDEKGEQIKACFKASNLIELVGLQDFLRVSLPEYMLPNEIVQLETIPLTVNGKINRVALLHTFGKIDRNQPELSNVHNDDVEKKVFGYLEELLEKKLPACDEWKEHMKEIGLDSLAAIKLILRIEEAYRFEFPDEDINAENIYNFDKLLACVRKHLK